MRRSSGASKGFGSTVPLPAPNSGYHGVIALAEWLSSPDAQASLDTLREIGRQMDEWRPKLTAFDRKLAEDGFPAFYDGVVLAPYDVVADHLRGMRGTMMDLNKHPDALVEVCDALLRRTLANLARPR